MGRRRRLHATPDNTPIRRHGSRQGASRACAETRTLRGSGAPAIAAGALAPGRGQLGPRGAANGQLIRHLVCCAKRP